MTTTHKLGSYSGLLSILFTVGCAVELTDPSELTEEDIAVHEEALTAVSFSASYSACGSTMSFSGYEPAEAGTYPVAVFLTGTGGQWNASGSMEFARQMALRGFVAATVQYSNGTYPSCSTMKSRAKCIFDANNANGALRKLCARTKAGGNGTTGSCSSKGFVTAGISQGSDLSSLAKDYNVNARGAYLISNVLNPSFFTNNTSCLSYGRTPPSVSSGGSGTKFSMSELRAVSGEADGFCSGVSDVRGELNTSTGRSCGSGVYDCLQGDGSGWYIVKNSQTADGDADHCYILQSSPSGSISSKCSSSNPTDSNYSNTSEPWGRNANYDWLASRAPY